MAKLIKDEHHAKTFVKVFKQCVAFKYGNVPAESSLQFFTYTLPQSLRANSVLCCGFIILDAL